MARRRITAEDFLKGAARSLLSGRALNPLETNRLVNEAHDERVARYAAPTRKGGFYSRQRTDGTIDVFVGPDGDITSERPHAHVIHSDLEKQIILVATDRSGRHLRTEYLPADASGNDVNRVVDRLRRLIA